IRISAWSSYVCSSVLVLVQFVGIVRLLKDFDQVANPPRLPVGTAAALLVRPVRGQPIFGLLVHRPAANLDLDPHILLVHDRRMQRLVAVALRGRDIVLEADRKSTRLNSSH